METNETVKRLGKLFQLDVDAMHAYDQAIKNIDVATVRNELQRFKADHERHLTDIASALRQLGREAPDRKQDIKGFLIEGFTAIRSRTGTEGALKAMKGNEELTNKTYRDSLGPDLPIFVREIVERNYQDEIRHLEYIERALRDQVWEKAPRA